MEPYRKESSVCNTLFPNADMHNIFALSVSLCEAQIEMTDIVHVEYKPCQLHVVSEVITPLFLDESLLGF